MGSTTLVGSRDPKPGDVPGLAPKPSRCDRCAGVFNQKPWAPPSDRSEKCESCGAGRHWEKASKSDPAAQPIYPRRGDGGFFVCFKCAERRLIEKGFVVCGPCRQSVPSSPEDASSDCGCAWNDERRVMLDPFVEMGPTVVARPPTDSCIACEGSGRIKDRHRHLHIKRTVGASGNDGDRYSTADRQLHFSPTRDERGLLAAGGWRIENAGSTGEQSGRKSQGIHDRLVALDVATGISTSVQLKITADGTLVTPRREWQRAVKRIVAQVPESVSAETAGEIFGLGKRRVQQIRKISPNPTKGGEAKKNS